MSLLFIDLETKDNPNAPRYAELFADLEQREVRNAEKERREIRPVVPALVPALAKIVAVGWAIDTEEPQALVSDDEELGLIRHLGQLMFGGTQTLKHTLIGFNIVNFDLPMFRQRAFFHGGGVPFVEIKPWENKIAAKYQGHIGLN